MRLLNAKTLELKNFFDTSRPPYLILSHRWVESETNLQEFEAQKHVADTLCNPGILKVKQFCTLARNVGVEWVWCDTVCIDKASSAELTEAINSMWQWYQDAHCCYVYMNDVESSEGGWRRAQESGDEATTEASGDGDPAGALAKLDLATDKVAEALEKSEWFTRGWTLQELLAPRELFFYDSTWQPIGERDEYSMAAVISNITKIDARYFGDLDEITGALVAERMSWISRRNTSRIEDLAYCMLGIFDVHMPLIYGEGLNSFLRLQLEIIAKYDDETVFCWQRPSDSPQTGIQSGMLAPSPKYFTWIFEEGVQMKRRDWIDRAPYRMTNKGIEFQVFDDTFMKTRPSWPVPLNVVVQGKGWVCLEIGNVGPGAWCRVHPTGFIYADRLLMNPDYPDEYRKRFNIYVRQLGRVSTKAEMQ